MKCNTLDWVAFALVIIGGLNWGLVGAFKFNLVDYLFGTTGLIAAPVVATVIYILVGLSAVYMLISGASKCHK